jgi:2-polyprenyl-3-methyl-5-hydroxy-6-metoxy-1,4-benzoquinol methylase
MDQADIESLRSDVLTYAARRNGRIYAPIDHPAFADVPYQHGAQRFEIIRPHIPAGARTALDIGTHWGYFAHKLEGLGLEVTAAESLKQYLSFLTRIRTLYDDRFSIWSRSIFEMPGPIQFDVILALNIFHHFLKTEPVFEQLKALLGRTDCRVMFFEPHDPEEGQMNGAFRNFDEHAFCDFIVSHSSLKHAKHIGGPRGRPIYALTK